LPWSSLRSSLVIFLISLNLLPRGHYPKFVSKEIGCRSLVLFYLASWTCFRFNFQWLDFTQEYLDQVRQVARHLSWWDLVLRRTPESTVLYNPFTFLIFPFIDRLDCWGYLQLRLAMMGVVIAIQVWLHRDRPLWPLVLSHLLLLLVVLDIEQEFNNGSYFETFFSLCFFLNLLLVLRLRPTALWAFGTGLWTAFTFWNKELGIFGLVLLVASVVWLDRPAARRVRWIGWAALGFLVPASMLFRSLWTEGVTEGLYHLPILSFRGWAMRHQITQGNVFLLLDQGVPFPVTEMIWNRLSFQTLGEFLFGAVRRVGLDALVPVFPMAWMAVHLPRRQVRLLGLFLGQAAVIYGWTYWKGGDSSDPLYTMLPFGYLFGGPYLVALGRSLAGHLRRGTLWRSGRIPLLALAAVQVVWLAGRVPTAWESMRRMQWISGWEGAGPRYHVPPDPGQRWWLDHLSGLHRQGRLPDRPFVTGCWRNPRMDALLTGLPDLSWNQLDLRDELLPALWREDREALQNALDLMARESGYVREPGARWFVLTCVAPGGLPPIEDPRGTVSLFGGCVEVQVGEVPDSGLALITFQPDSCGTFWRPELDSRRGVRQERPPRIPLVR